MLRRSSPRFLMLVFLLALVGIIGMSTVLNLAQAQPAAQDEEQAQAGQATDQATDQQPAGTDAQAATDGQDSGQQANPEPAPDADAAVAAGEAQADPEDGQGIGRFIPTEQISQDLGVSFPVDI